VSAFLLGASFLIFIVNFVWSQWINPTKSPTTRGTRSASSGRHPTPVPWYNFERIPVVNSDPYHYGEPGALPGCDLGREPLVTAGVVSKEEAVQPGELESPDDTDDFDPRPPIL